MKILLTFLFLAFTLFARENPFETTKTFEEKKQEYLKQIELEKQAQKEAELAIKKEKELQELAKKLQKEKLQKKKLQELALKEQAKREALQKEELKKKEQNAIKYNPLNFVKFKVYESSLVIYIDQSYKLINTDILKPVNKFLFDFKADASFYTKRKVLNSHPFYKSIVVGNHPKKGFFRVVIETNGDISSYKEDIKIENGTITINKL